MTEEELRLERRRSIIIELIRSEINAVEDYSRAIFESDSEVDIKKLREIRDDEMHHLLELYNLLYE